MIQVIGMPMGFNPAPFFVDHFLAHKEAECVKTQRKLGTNRYVRKSMFEKPTITFGLFVTCYH